MSLNSAQQTRIGLAAGIGANTMWGLLPAYLKLTAFAAPLEVLAHRVLWSLPAAGLAVVLLGGAKAGLAALRQRGAARALALSAVLIAINWGVYVWAVSEARVIEASLAYFLTPLVNVAFGVAFFAERLSRLQGVALVLAGVGVALQALALQGPPWVALILCATWSCYGLVRKRLEVPAAAGLFLETLLLAVPALGVLAYFASRGELAAAEGPGALALLALAGPATAAPLILFVIGARRLRFSTIGLLQYIAPTLQFVLGWAYGEPLTLLRGLSFAWIWAGLAAFTWDALRREGAVRLR